MCVGAGSATKPNVATFYGANNYGGSAWGQAFGSKDVGFEVQVNIEIVEDRVYVTRYKGDGALTAMLNARLSSTYYAAYADLMAAMPAGTAARHILSRPSLQTALARAQREATQIGAEHPVWDAAARLFPGVLNGLLRADDLGALPGWAAIDSDSDRQAANGPICRHF